MNMRQNSIPLPVSVAETAQQRVEAAERVAGLMEHPGWPDLRRALELYGASRIQTWPVCKEGYPYADLVGELKGIGKIEAIAAGVVQVGETAASELRAAEDGGEL